MRKTICPVLIAHRGDPSRGPENTLAGVRLALEAEPDFIEVDVHLSADGQVVVIHDADLERTTSGAGEVSKHTLQQLRGLDAGSWYGAEFAGEGIPTLAEVWQTARDRSRLATELKGEGTGAVVGRWARGLSSSAPAFVSFRAEELRALKREFPKAELRLISAQPLGDAEQPARLCALAGELGCVGVSVYGPECPPKAIERVHRGGLEVWVWTINDPAEWEGFIRAGVDGITTDTPLRLHEFLVERGLRPAQGGERPRR